MTRWTTHALASLALAMGLPASALAASIHWSIEGRVGYVSPDTSSLGVQVQLGDPVQARLDFDLPPGANGLEPNADFDIRIGAFDASHHPSAYPLAFFTQYDPYSGFYSYGGGDLRDSYQFAFLTLGWNEAVDPTLVFPEDPPALSSLRAFVPQDDFSTGLHFYDNGTEIDVELTSIERVPEPGVWALLGLGLGCLALRRLRTG